MYAPPCSWYQGIDLTRIVSYKTKLERTCNNDKNLSEIQLEHEKEDELVAVVVKVVHECRHWMEELEWWFEQDIDDEEEEDEEGEGGSEV
ncbi:hypothetical protein Tco_0729019 [Tanacetum coccineum]|uniref:Uncharacterized protein n=1 Tax=Tanacetum coccineum TaxID=301880 RepID=A0ABQ4YMT2_9ASTR